MDGIEATPYTVRYWEPDLRRMRASFWIGLMFCAGPIVFFRAKGNLESPMETLALWGWGLAGLPLGIFIFNYCWWGIQRLSDDRIALKLNDEDLRIVCMYLPEVCIPYSQLQEVSFHDHQSSAGVMTSLCFKVNDPIAAIRNLPWHVRWWAKMTNRQIGTPFSLPARLVDQSLDDIREMVEGYMAMAANPEVIAQIKAASDQWLSPFKTDEEFANHFIDGPVGHWQSKDIGFTYAPMDRLIWFGPDGTGWVDVALLGPKIDFGWKSLGNHQIQVWTLDEPEKPYLLTMSIVGRVMMLVESDDETTLDAPTPQLVSELGFDELTYAPSIRSSPSSS